MTEQWFCSTCPECKSRNWINNGDPNDMTVPDIQGINCWNCKHSWKVYEFDEVEDEDDVYYEDGRHFEEVSE